MPTDHSMSDVAPMPRCDQHERSLLGCVLLWPEVYAEVAEQVTAGDFYRDTHTALWTMLGQMLDGGDRVDCATVIVRAGPHADRYGGAAYISSLGDEAVSAEAAQHYAAEIRAASRRRNVVSVARRIEARALAGDDLETLGDDVERLTQESISVRGPQHISRVCDETLIDIADRQSLAERGEVPGILHGLMSLERAAPLERGRLVCIAGRPGMGKTALAGAIAVGAAERGEGVAFFEHEMTAVQMAYRMACSRVDVSTKVIRAGRYSRDVSASVRDSLAYCASLPLWIDDSASLTVERIAARARGLKSRHPDLGLVFVDHIGLVRASSPREPRHLQLGHVSGGLKVLAKELDVCVVMLAQLNRAVEERSPPKPKLSDLRESGRIEEDIDLAWLLYRPEYYLRDNTPDDQREVVEVDVAKGRDDGTGLVRLRFVAETVRFMEPRDRRW